MYECLIYTCVYLTELHRNFVSIDNELYSLVWNDEFSEDGRLDNWMQYQPGRRRDAINHPNSVEVVDGRLIITTSSQGGETPTTGMIRTKKEFLYGYFETKVRFQKHQGHWSAMWLQSSIINQFLTPTQGGVEFDIFEYRANQPDIIQTALHWGGYGDNHQIQKQLSEISNNTENPWYIIGGLWTEAGWKVYINGNKYAEFDHPVSSQFQYIVLSLEVSKWAGEIPKNQFQDSVEFDYIRVYGEFK